MNLATFLNDYVFPFILFLGFLFILHNPDIFEPQQDNKLELFFNQILEDAELCDRIESLTNKEEFVIALLKLSQQLGYSFTITEIEQAIKEGTDERYSNYVCLPIGCWQFS